jgi:hypothetical protein
MAVSGLNDPHLEAMMETEARHPQHDRQPPAGGGRPWIAATGTGRPRRRLVWLAVSGNALFAAWILYNAIDDGFRGTLPQIVSGLGLIALLSLDTLLLVRERERS